MQIYNGIITLNYDLNRDVLISDLPDTQEFGLSEVNYCLGVIVENVRNYDIKHLLLDSSKSVVGLEGDAYNNIVSNFSRDLMNTRLKKIARVVTSKNTREEKLANFSVEIKQELNLAIQFKNFVNQAEALQWLSAATD